MAHSKSKAPPAGDGKGWGMLSPHTVAISWALALVGAVAVGFVSVGWPFIDLYDLLLRVTSLSWREATERALGMGVEYRPTMIFLVKGIYEVFGPTLWVYKALVLAQFAVILVLLVRIMAPSAASDGLAAGVALCCFVGLHTSRMLTAFWPLNSHSLALLLILWGVVICLSPRRGWHDWVLGVLTLVASSIIELGLLIPPLVVALYLVRAQGVSKRGMLLSLLAAVAYGTMRLSLSSTSSPPLVHAETGWGFASEVPIETLARIAESTPLLFWGYNVSATAFTVLFSEPRAGRYIFVESLLKGSTPAWLWLHVGVSTLSTCVVALGVAAWRRTPQHERQVMTAGIVLLLGSVMGFLYTRDRIALAPGAGYSLLLYASLLRFRRLGTGRLVRAGVAVLLCGWLVRDAETVLLLRDSAWESYMEWTERYEDLGGHLRPQTQMLQELRRQATSRPPADPRRDPAWTYVLFEREFGRIVETP